MLTTMEITEIKKKMKEKGMSQNKLALELDFVPACLSKWLNQKGSGPLPENREKLLDYLGIAHD